MRVDREPKRRVDFHVHYDADPDQARVIMEKADKRSIEALGLITRMTIPDEEDIYRITRFSEAFGFNVIHGVEINCMIGGKHVDLIAMAFNTNNINIRKLFGNKDNAEGSSEVAQHQKQLLEKIGFRIRPQDQSQVDVLDRILNGEIMEKAINFCRIVISSPENSSLIDKLKDEHLVVWQLVEESYKVKEGKNK